jgi:CheY-like chemotaxis protein
LHLAADCRPDLALIDISMPDMSGWELARQLRQIPDLSRLKIAMVSANAHEYSRGGGDGSVHDAFLMKPIDVQLLLDSIATLMGLSWLYEPSPETTATPAISDLAEHSRHHIDDLYQLGRIGHVRGIEAKLREIETEDPANKAFATRLRALVANFDLKRYMNVLETMRNDG